MIQTKVQDEEIKTNAEGKKIIKCTRVRRQDLTLQETLDIRAFYWAAFYGFDSYLKIMVEELRWSPFIKSFKLRSIVSGAIMG